MVKRKKQLWLRISSLMLVFVFMVASSNISAMAASALSISAKANTSEVSLGQNVVLSATAKGGSGNYTYSFLVCNKSTGEWARLTDSFTKNNTFTWKAQTAGKREFYVEVKDSTGKVVRSKAIPVNTINKLSVTGSTSASTIELGNSLKITAKATGGSGSYTYSYIVYNQNTGKWARLADNITKNTYTWKAKDCADRIFYIDVKDSTGKVVRSKALNVSVVNKLTVTASVNDTEVEKGQSIKLTAKATGGSGIYRYSYIVFNKNTNKWYRLADNISSKEYTWKANDVGERVFYIDVKDSATGKVVRSNAINIVVPDKIPVTGVKLNNSKLNLKAGSSEKLIATISPSNADNKAVVWSSSNTKVATVDNNGLVKAVGNGDAIITVKTVDSGYTATCKVYVTTPVTGVKVNMDTVELEVGMGIMILETVLPSTASNQLVMWRSSNPNIVTVNEKGYAVAIANGEATITVTTVDGGYKASCKVTTRTVTDGVSLNVSTLNLNAGAGSQLTATVKPETASNKLVTWSSSNTAVATVNGSGYVTAVGNGTATITVKTADGGKTASCTVTVRTAPTGVSLNTTTLNLNAGAGSQLTATVLPGTASNKSVTWSSSNTAVATVNGSGYVTAVGNGTATITVKTTDGGKTASCTVTVTTPVESVTLNTNSLNLKVGETAQLTATVHPNTASNKWVAWGSTHEGVMVVNENGLVTAVGNGTATIIVTTGDGHKTAHCTVTVTTPVEGVTLNTDSLNLTIGETAQLTATVHPNTASNQWVAWGSTHEGVMVVNENGLVTAVGNGTATIIVTTGDGHKTAYCTVTVTTKTTGVGITNKQNVILDCDSSSKTYQCNISVSPDTASDKSVTWSSSNTGVATVNGNGLITAVGVGTATITVKTNASGHQDTINVYVYESKAVAPGGTFQLSIGSTTNRVMDVYDACAYNGAVVQLFTPNKTTAQAWEFHDYSSSNGGYAIVPKCQTNGCILDVNRGNSINDPLKAGCKVDLWLIGQDNPASMFDLVRFWDGSYAFKLINSNLVVGVTSTEVGTQLVAKNFDVNDMNQRWFLEKVEISSNVPTEFNQKLQAFKNSYPENYSKGDGNPYTWSDAPFYVNGEFVGYQCFGFADLIAYNVLGSYPTKQSSGNNLRAGWTIKRATESNTYVSSIKVGDVVRYANNGWDHSIFITDIVGDTIYYADFNGKGDEKIYYNRTIDKNTLNLYLKNILNDGSGYRGWIAHYGN